MRKVLPFLFVLFMATSAMAERVAMVIGVEGTVTVVREGNHLPVTRRAVSYTHLTLPTKA